MQERLLDNMFANFRTYWQWLLQKGVSKVMSYRAFYWLEEWTGVSIKSGSESKKLEERSREC